MLIIEFMGNLHDISLLRRINVKDLSITETSDAFLN